MSATGNKNASGWAHKRASPAQTAIVEMYKIARDCDGLIHTPHGHLPRTTYEELRLAHPDAGLPAFDDLPLLATPPVAADFPMSPKVTLQ